MNNLKPLLILLALPILSACDQSGFCIQGEGDVETRTLDLSRFEGVEVSGSTKVFISRGSNQKVEVKGQANILDLLETDVEGDVWDIEFERCISNHKAVEVYITVPQLSSANVSGSGYVELEDRFRVREFDAAVSGAGDIKGKIDADVLESRISGSGTIELSGAANRQEVKISGSGKYYAFDLRSREVTVNISGSGQAQVDASDVLDASISGSGRVRYRGNPETNLAVSGSGKVMKD